MNDMEYIIRKIEEKDNKSVENVIRSCLIEFGANHEGTAWADPDLGRFSEVFNSPGNEYWVAEDEQGRIVGGTGIGFLEGEDEICELKKMYCLPEARGTGVAHLLMRQALDYAGRYYKKCYLETLPNMLAAQRFYEKYGFVRVYETVGSTTHFACDVRYIKDLMKTKTTNTYLFDFDGTLVDSMPTYVSVMLRILDERGIVYGDDIVKIITPLGYRGTAEYFRTLGARESVDELVEIMNAYARFEYENNIPAKDGVIETLREMKERGYSLNVLTASPHLALDPCLKRIGVWDLFDNVWSCDDFSTTKANPEIYRMAAERIGRSVGEIIFVDDNINAVKTAKRAGMISFGIFDESGADYVDEFKAMADGYVMNFAELIK